MELELKKECLDTYELGEPQTLTQEETAETIVPDYCPDIARIISAEGVVCLHGGTEQDGVTGTVRVTVLYTPEGEGGIRTLEFAMPFTVETDGRSLPDCAALLAEDGRVFTGCNVENAAYGNTLCAERTALVKAVSEGCRRFTKIAIASAGSAPYPCGACRQSLYEFAPELEVLVTWDGNVARAPLGELVPHGLGPSSLGR